MALHTRTRLAIRKQSFAEAAELAAEAIQISDARADRLMSTSLRALKVDALVGLNRLAEAQRAMAEAAQILDSPPLAIVAELERVRGKLYTGFGLRDRAVCHFERALDILSGIGFVSARWDVEADYKRALASFGEPIEIPTGPSATGAGELETTSPLLAVRRATRPADIEAAVALFDLGGYPDLLGREALALLADGHCTEGAALLARDASGAVEVVAATGWPDGHAPDLERATDGLDAAELGRRNDRTYTLVVRPRSDVVARSLAAAILRAARTAAELDNLRSLEKERSALWPPESITDTSEEIYVAAEMTEILATARKIAPTDLHVLLTGETGTGKEMLARAVHRASTRASKPFLPFNCTAVPRDMVESQLFGYRRGAFTGAHETFPGVIRAVEGGTLFLDEIAELGPDVQPKLLRFLETKEIHPLGEANPVTVDVRIIAATNANIDRLVSEGRFREDLFYRLNTIRFRLPPLRERREEIPALVQHYLRRYSAELKKGRLSVSEETMEFLLLYSWPGNVRQLANELRRLAALVEPDTEVPTALLSPEILNARRTVPADTLPSTAQMLVRIDQPLVQALEAVERAMIERALSQSRGRVEEAARLLGISRKGLFLKRRRWGVQPPNSSN